MRFNRTAAVVLRQFYLLKGSVPRILPLFAWVAIDIVLWGFITRYLNSVTSPGMNFVTTLLGAVLLWDFFARVMQGVTMAFLEDVWARNFLNIFATPLKISEYVGGLVFSSIITSAAGLIVMLILAMVIFGLSYVVYGLMIIPFFFVLFFFGIALGIFGAGLVLRFGPASEWFIWPIPAIVSPVAGVFYPLSTLPGWMRAISYLLPPSYVFEGMRTIIATGTFPIMTLLWSIVLGLLYIVGAFRFFAWVFNYAVRTGLIARYSAETVA